MGSSISILSLIKLVLISLALLFILLGLNSFLPLATTHFHLLLLCFKPPYLYLILNAIIISILASSRSFHSNSDSNIVPTPPSSPSPPVYPRVLSSKAPIVVFQQEEAPLLEVKAVIVNGCSTAIQEEEEEEVVKEIDDGMVSVEETTWTSSSSSSSLKWIHSVESPPEYRSAMERPLVSARFAHRKPLKSNNPEGGRALRVAKENQHMTLENTWKAITAANGGGRKQITTKKARETWDPLEVKKSATFKDRTHLPSSSTSDAERAITESRRVESASRSFHTKLQQPNKVAKTRIIESVHADD